jgi:hypothetical protein
METKELIKMRKRGAPVVILRKDKKIRHKLLHLGAFAVTGGLSGVVTATEVANNAGYNARTRKLQAEAEEVETGTPPERWRNSARLAAMGQNLDPAAAFRRDHVPASKEYKAAHGG